MIPTEKKHDEENEEENNDELLMRPLDQKDKHRKSMNM